MSEKADCRLTFQVGESTPGQVVYVGSCVTCGLPLQAGSEADLRARFTQHASIDPPPAEVLARTITPFDIDSFPAYFLNGPGYRVASKTVCPHGRVLTDPCPACD
ncbi:hypothetical protein [Nocardia farcinica]|uniref:hypothetical protein n=1 Tax=Nocardia farcinica TaxID=37329 RepID=UPI0024548A59|nr:hypothetical protein [Nocardia farcinica]